MVKTAKQEDISEEKNLILMLLSKDLRDRYMNNLVQRLIKIGVVVAIEEIDYPNEKNPVLSVKKIKNLLSWQSLTLF